MLIRILFETIYSLKHTKCRHHTALLEFYFADGKTAPNFLQGRVQAGTTYLTQYGIPKKPSGSVSLYHVDHHLLCNIYSPDTKLWTGRIDDVTTSQLSDSRNQVSELCMDSIQAYVGKQYSMLSVGIRSCDIPFSHRDFKVVLR